MSKRRKRTMAGRNGPEAIELIKDSAGTEIVNNIGLIPNLNTAREA